MKYRVDTLELNAIAFLTFNALCSSRVLLNLKAKFSSSALLSFLIFNSPFCTIIYYIIFKIHLLHVLGKLKLIILKTIVQYFFLIDSTSFHGSFSSI